MCVLFHVQLDYVVLRLSQITVYTYERLKTVFSILFIQTITFKYIIQHVYESIFHKHVIGFDYNNFPYKTIGKSNKKTSTDIVEAKYRFEIKRRALHNLPACNINAS